MPDTQKDDECCTDDGDGCVIRVYQPNFSIAALGVILRWSEDCNSPELGKWLDGFVRAETRRRAQTDPPAEATFPRLYTAAFEFGDLIAALGEVYAMAIAVKEKYPSALLLCDQLFSYMAAEAQLRAIHGDRKQRN